jgi:hypothetical protein
LPGSQGGAKGVRGVEGCLERIGEDEVILRILWEDEAEKDTVLEILKAECEVRPGRPQNFRP